MNNNQIIVILVFVVFCMSLILFKDCTGYDKTVIDNKKLLEKEIEVQKLKEERLIYKDSIKALNDSILKANISHSEEVFNLEERISYIKGRVIKIPQGEQAIHEFFSMRYGDPDLKPLGPLFYDTVIHELLIKDQYAEILPMKDSIIMYKDSIIFGLGKQYESTSSLLVLTEQELKEREDMHIIAKRNILGLQNNLNMEKGKNRALVLYGIPAGVIVGGVVGFLIAK